MEHTSKKAKYQCESCNQVFNRAQRLESHRSKESCNTTCTVCKRKFRSRRDLLCHHQNPVYNSCDLCDKKFCNDTDHNNHQIVEHHTNSRKCKTCSKEFKVFSDLKKHCKDASPRDCDLCDKTFCTPAEYKNHWIVEHRGGQVETEEDPEYVSILKQMVYPPTGLENEDGYKEMIAKHADMIKDNVVARKDIFMTVNKEITPLFTYKELCDLIKKAVLKHGKACRFNIGFGFILKNKLTDAYRYYYVSTNHLLFDKAATISTMSEVKDIVKTIHDVNIGERYYMQRPASCWMLAGMTNVQFKLMYLNIVLG